MAFEVTDSARRGLYPEIEPFAFGWMPTDSVHEIYFEECGAPNGKPVLTGEAQMIIASLLATLPHAKSGRLRALAVTTMARSNALPDVPTASESGLPKFETSSWHGMLAPAGTSPAIVTKLHAEFVKAITQPDVKERLNAQGLDVVASTPEQFDAHIRSETAKYARVIKQLGLKAE